MEKLKNLSRKIIPLTITVLVLMVVAFAIGYYLSLVRYDQKYTQLKEREEKAKEEANRLKMMGFLLEAKGEIISSNIALSEEEVNKSLEHLDASIAVLRNAFDLADGEIKEKIENFRLNLATIKGIIGVDSSKAQTELDKLWREMTSFITLVWESKEGKIENKQ